MPSATEQQLDAWLLPGDVGATESLVGASGLKRLTEFTQLSTYLASQPCFDDLQPAILATMEQFADEPLDVLFRRLSSPIFRAWLSRFGAVQHFARDDPLLDEQMRLWNNMRHSLVVPGDYRTTMTVVDRCCMTWDARLAVRVGEHAAVIVERQNDRLIIRSMDDEGLLDAEVDQEGCHSIRQLGEGCRVNFARCLPGSQIALRNDLPLLQLRLLGTERESAVELGTLDHSKTSYPTFNPDPYLQAAAIIGEVWPEEYADFRQTLHVVVPRTSPRRWHARGMTVSSYAGAIWLFVDTLVDLVEHMVHEQSHVKLRYVEEACPILTPDQTGERFLVGWRKDPRPIVGIYEGVYVHLHVLTALSACRAKHIFSGENAATCEARCRSVIVEVEEGLRLLEAHGRFTDTGSAYLPWAAETLGDLRSRAT